MNSLSMIRSTAKWKSLFRQGLTWWLSELVSIVPVSLRYSFIEDLERLTLRFGQTTATLIEPSSRNRVAKVYPIQLDGKSAACALEQDLRGSKVRIVLSDDLVFRCLLEFPFKAETELEKIITHQLDRLVPLDPTSVDFTWQIKDRLAARKTLIVSVAIIKIATQERALFLARELLLNPTEICLAFGEGSSRVIWRAPPLRKSVRHRLFVRGVDILIILSLFAAYGTSVLRLDIQVENLRWQLRSAESDTRSAQQLKTKVAETESLSSSIKSRLAHPTALAVLNELTLKLPLSASISSFEYQSNRVSIVGVAPHATDLLAILTQSSMLNDVRFTAPITAAPDGNGEHFELTMQLTPLNP